MLNKTVLITGSSRGIGQAIALEYAKAGYNIILNAKTSKDALAQTENKVKAYGVKCLSFLLDVSDYDKVSEMFCAIRENFTSLDVVVNNAGISHVGLFTDTTPLQWDTIINVNLKSAYNILHHAVPIMVSQKRGNIINISSIWGVEGASCEVAYSASKGALNALTKSLAKELGPSNIRVNAIACGAIETDMNNWLSPEEKETFSEDIPLCRFGYPSEVAKTAYFLGSDESSYLTGDIIKLDGGL